MFDWSFYCIILRFENCNSGNFVTCDALRGGIGKKHCKDPCNGLDDMENSFYWVHSSSVSNTQYGVRKDKFLEVPQIVWGLNNQKISFARACLTSRMLNRTLLMPSLSASLFYKELELLQPISFDKIFQFERFNSLCNGFVRLSRYSDLSNRTVPFELQKGSGRKWTVERDLDQLKQCRENPIDEYESIRIVGKNPFLWHDHWPVKDYAKIFECLVLIDEIADEATKVVSKIREMGSNLRSKTETLQQNISSSKEHTPYVAVHMRIEKDWMIHCKKLEQRSNISQICSSKEEIMDRVAHIRGLTKPIILFLAVADSLLEDASVLSGWPDGFFPFEKKKLGVWDIYNKYPYLIKSAIDYEVCLRADIFVGNSFSTFSSLIALERTQKLIAMGGSRSCGLRWSSYAYNILGAFGGPQRWMTDMSDSSLNAISYGSNKISC
ncbi:O-fucosyltransferase family protein isoform X2 [Tasmannia lanceolata]|uniref:O-fucosyltransferase family protein isoform X2 n=2 Tax=Tasmannia lanceolata TaxID=3420 RepID=UPI00406465C7